MSNDTAHLPSKVWMVLVGPVPNEIFAFIYPGMKWFAVSKEAQRFKDYVIGLGVEAEVYESQLDLREVEL